MFAGLGEVRRAVLAGNARTGRPEFVVGEEVETCKRVGQPPKALPERSRKGGAGMFALRNGTNRCADGVDSRLFDKLRAGSCKKRKGRAPRVS